MQAQESGHHRLPLPTERLCPASHKSTDMIKWIGKPCCGLRCAGSPTWGLPPHCGRNQSPLQGVRKLSSEQAFRPKQQEPTHCAPPLRVPLGPGKGLSGLQDKEEGNHVGSSLSTGEVAGKQLDLGLARTLTAMMSPPPAKVSSLELKKEL